MNKKFTVSALIACAGSGTRMKQLKKKDGTIVNKVFREIGNVPVVAHTIHAFEQTPCIDDIVLITREADLSELAQIVKTFAFQKCAQLSSVAQQDSSPLSMVLPRYSIATSF